MSASLQSFQSPAQAAQWLRAQVQGTLRADSRQVQAGDGFIAWPGAATDGRQYVPGALAAGAAACLVEQDGVDAYGFVDARVAAYAGLKADTGPIAAAYFEEPSRHLQVMAVTGTNGKTSTAWWLAQALARTGRPCGVVGTLGIGVPGAMVSNGLTTPDPVLLQQQLRQFVDQGFAACAIEASSIGLQEQRLDGTAIKTAIFTNFTQDHLDYHASMDAYWDAKAALFDWPGLEVAVVNVDDLKGVALSGLLAGRAVDLWTVSCQSPARQSPARLRAVNIQHGAVLKFDVLERGNEVFPVTALAVGLYNVSNLLGVIAALRAIGLPLAEAVSACNNLLPVPGRTETLAFDDQPLVVIDYAHTPDALEKVLTALRPTAQSRGGVLWCVFGCGGDRDPIKRPLMAAVAEKCADQVVVTSDNPRHENPLAIISQILLGLSHRDAVHVQADRAAAIAHALQLASAQDVVLIAGKGHESYQEMAGEKLPFSDREQAESVLRAQPARRAPGATA